MANDSIEMKIAKIAARNWGQQEPTTIEEASGITWGSEVAAINGIARVIGLDSEDVEKLVGTKAEDGKQNLDGQIYTQDVISEDIASKISNGIYRGDKNDSVLQILSTIHNEWVRNNSNNFLKVNDKGERRNKERQFVPLELLDWGEVQSDLLFLKPILEASGIELDEQQLKSRFEIAQQEFLLDNGITSHEKLVEFLSKGAKSYPALDGIETKFGGNIEELLQDPKVAEEMAGQIESRVEIKSAKEIGEEVLYSNNPELDDVLWANTIVDNPTFDEKKCPRINGPISRREILLSKAIGIPYPTYIESGISDHNHDEYRVEFKQPRDAQWDVVDRYKGTLDDKKMDFQRRYISQKAQHEIQNSLLDKKIGIAHLGEYGGDIAMSKTMYRLGHFYGLGFPSSQAYDHKFSEVHTESEFTIHEEHNRPATIHEKSPDSEIKAVKKMESKISQFRKKVDRSEDGRYDKKGTISLPRYVTGLDENSETAEAHIQDYVEIEVTQRELIEAGILPDEVKWKQKALVTAKDIASADKEQDLTTTEVGGVKGFINRLMDKYKGKGEI